MGLTKSNQLTIGKVDEQVAYNKETNTLELGTNVEVDGNLIVNGEIIVDEKVKKLFNYYDVDEMFGGNPLETTIKDLMLKALGITSFPSFSATHVTGIFKINNILYFGTLSVYYYGTETFTFNLYKFEDASFISDELLMTNRQNVAIGNIIYNNTNIFFYKYYHEVQWKNNQIISKKEIQLLLKSLNKVLIDINTGLVLELVKYSANEIILITKDIRYDDLVCYITEYTFKTIVGDEENYLLTIHDDISVTIDHS